MPITLERFHNLLSEHENALALTRRVIEACILITHEPHSDSTLASVRGLLQNLDRDLPQHLADSERKHYNRNLKWNLRARKRKTSERRRNGVTERKSYDNLSPAEALARLEADDEYEQFSRGETKARKLTNEEFLAKLPPPAPIDEAQIVADSVLMLDELTEGDK
jgi:hypothetical protein